MLTQGPDKKPLLQAWQDAPHVAGLSKRDCSRGSAANKSPQVLTCFRFASLC